MSQQTDSDKIAAAVRLVIDYADADALVADYVDEISRGRVFVETNKALVPGAAAELILCSPELRQAISIAGVVTNVESAGVSLDLVALRGPQRRRIDEAVRLIQRRDPRLVAHVFRILVVEDNPHILRILEEGLRSVARKRFERRVTFDVWKAESAAAASSLLERHDFALIIADIHLGGVAGTRVIEQVRRDPNLEAIPIIAISAGDESTRKRALDAGADVFIAKPMRLLNIVDSMRRLLELDPEE
jgi:CheY-like chemotaxis protein